MTKTEPHFFLNAAIDNISAKAALRDLKSERSMLKTINMFNSMTGRDAMSEREGWLFMVLLKIARAQNGERFHEDDYVDAAAYVALAGECASFTETACHNTNL